MGPHALYVSVDYEYFALDKVSGSVIWSSNLTDDERTLPGESLIFPPLLTSSGLILQVSKSYLYGVNSSTGRLVWYRHLNSGSSGCTISIGPATDTVSFQGQLTTTPSKFTTPLALSANETIFCGGVYSGFVFCAQTADGSLIWSRYMAQSYGENMAGMVSVPFIHNETMYMSSPHDGYGCHATNMAANVCRIRGEPASGNQLYYEYVRGRFFLFAYSLAGGAELWNISLSNKNPLQVSPPLAVLRSFISPTIDALVLVQSYYSSVEVYVINPSLSGGNGTLVKTIPVPGASSLVGNVAVDSSNALFVMAVSTLTKVHSLCRINATLNETDAISYTRVVGTTATAVTISPTTFSLP